ncbi:DUF499 domain-containing protein [Cryobacterium breve]|nr:DUF499 domain-containing protein [Cryobacterium breve]
MLALWHLASGLPLGSYPQEAQELLNESDYPFEGLVARRVALVGNHFAPQGEVKPDGTRVNTLWGELAWQLGGAEAFEIVAEHDIKGTNPGADLHRLFNEYSPAVILIDEWVAYARQALRSRGPQRRHFRHAVHVCPIAYGSCEVHARSSAGHLNPGVARWRRQPGLHCWSS